MWQKVIKFIFCKFFHAEKFGRQWDLNHIYSNKHSEITGGSRKWRNRFKREKFVVLAEYLEQQTDYCRYKKVRKSRRGPLWRRNQPYFPFLIQQMETMPRSYQQSVRNLRTALEKYFGFHWNRKQVRVKARNSMLNFQIYFSLFSETIHTILKIFSQHGLRKCR